MCAAAQDPATVRANAARPTVLNETMKPVSARKRPAARGGGSGIGKPTDRADQNPMGTEIDPKKPRPGWVFHSAVPSAVVP